MVSPQTVNDLPPEGNAPRPKFSRRPASFARTEPELDTAAATVPLTPALPRIVADATKVPALPSLAWQEDARFGIVMLLLVVLVNLALVYGLPYLPKNTTEHPTLIAPKSPSMPIAVGHSGNRVTTYAQPQEEQRMMRMLDLNKAEIPGNALTVDTPPPVAEPLDDPESE